jgi:hypothetical protein
MNLPLSSMTTAEKIAAMEELWASLQSNADATPAPEWHAKILADRQKRIDNGETSFSSLQEVRERLENRHE